MDNLKLLSEVQTLRGALNQDMTYGPLKQNAGLPMYSLPPSMQMSMAQGAYNSRSHASMGVRPFNLL